MFDFTFHNPTRIVFGKKSIAKLSDLVPKSDKVLITYGGGSVKKNGVYDQVALALKDHDFIEFGGIEPNPRYETLMKAVELARKEQVKFLLSVGGGSTLDGTKFIAAAIEYTSADPWDIPTAQTQVQSAVPIGCVLTLAATGSESNGYAVISRDSTKEKRAFFSELCYPQFAILDPETTYTLPVSQTLNGIVDPFVHVMEQYMTYDVNAPLQDRQAEAILATLIEEGPKVIADPNNYDARANVMWCATQALNGLIACGVPQDWATHMIGHELTALYGIDHAQSLAVVLPALLRNRLKQKAQKLVQFGRRIWNINDANEDDVMEKAIARTEEFFQSLGVKTRLSQYGITEGVEQVGIRIEKRNEKLGEHQDIERADIDAILTLCRD